MAVVRQQGLLSRSTAILCVIAALAVTIVVGQPKIAELLAAGVAGLGAAAITVRVAARWDLLLYILAAADLLIPEDARYTLRGINTAGFQLEPYRLLISLMIVGWIAGLLVDPRVRFRKTLFDGPLILIWVAIIGSEMFNIARADSLVSYMEKSLAVAITLTVFLYMIVSVVRTMEVVERILRILVVAGCFMALAAVVERETTFSIFNHLHRILLVFNYNPASPLVVRGGHFRAESSAGTPIELSAEMAMLTPIAAYLGLRERWIWWLAVPLLLIGNLSSGSRTGVVGLLAVVAVFLWLRPKQTLSCWPALIPLLVVLQLVMPGTISGAVDAFFPKGGLIAQQNETFVAHGQVQDASRLSRIGPQLHNVFEKHNELFGEGFGTEVTGRTTLAEGVLAADQSAAADNAQILDDQWLGNLLSTGLVGFVAWLWLFVRVLRRLGRRARKERHTPQSWLPVALAAAIGCYGVSMAFYDAASFMQGTVMFYLLLGCAGSLLWMEVPRQRDPTVDLPTGGAPKVESVLV